MTKQTAKVLKFEEPKKASVQDILKKATVTKEKKSGTPMLSVPQETKQLAQEVKDIKTELENLTSMLDLKGGQLITEIRPLRTEYIKAREFVSSVKIPCVDSMTLTLSFSSNYVKCPPESEDAIIDAIGEDKYRNYFNVLNTITVKSDIEPAKLEDLINRVGAEEFAEFFEVSTNIKPNERFKIDQFFKFSAEELDALELAGVKAYKPAIKK